MKLAILMIFFLTTSACSHKEPTFDDLITDEGPVATATATETATATTPTQCEYQGQSYEPNETFAAADGCNECQCQSGDKIICTLKDCEAMEAKAKAERQRLRKFKRL